jgi:hypothetical protein
MEGHFAPDPSYTGHENFHPGEIMLFMFNDEDWEEYLKMQQEGSLCLNRIKLAKWRQRVDKTKDGFREVFTGSVRTHYWYLVVGDCRLEEYDAHPPKLFYNISFMNCEGKCADAHLPADEHGLFTMHLLLFLVMAFAGVTYASLMLKNRNSTGQIHLVAVLLGVAYLFQTASIFFELCHLFVYRQDGKGLRFRYTLFAADFFSEVMQGLSELVISVVLLAIASGWTLAGDFDMLSGSGTTGGKGGLGGMSDALQKPAELFKKITPASVFIAFIFTSQLVLEFMGRGYEDDFNQFHDHEHLPGYLLMLLRVLMCVVFQFGIISTKKNVGGAVSRFLLQLQICGTLWFLGFPCLVFVSGYFAAYLRHRIVTGGSLLCQAAALGYMAYLFLFKSEYHKLSSLSRMGTVSMEGVDTKSTKLAVD